MCKKYKNGRFTNTQTLANYNNPQRVCHVIYYIYILATNGNISYILFLYADL